MLTVITGLILGVLYFIRYYFKKRNTFWFDQHAIIIHMFIGCALGLICTIFIPQKTTIEVTELELASIADNSSISARFFIGTGTVEGKMVYAGYIKKGKGYKLIQIPIDNSEIIYTTSNPHIKIIDKKPILLQFGFPFSHGKKYEIYIPENSIKTNYNLDAQ